MNKAEFLSELKKRLEGISEGDIERSCDYYSEIIDDCMEEGESEEEAVAALGSMDDIVSRILSETSFAKLVIEKIKPKRKLEGWEIALIVLSSPVWLPVLLSVFAAIFIAYICIWAVIAVMYAVDLVFAASSVFGIFGGTVIMTSGKIPQGIFVIGVSLIIAGMSILLFFASNLASKLLIFITKKCALWLKGLFVKKEG